MESGFTSEWLRTTFLMGAVQGVFLAAVLAGRRKMLPDRLLGAAMLVFSMDLAAAVYHAAGYDRLYPQFIGLDFPISLLYGPLFYLYAQTLLERRPSLTWADSPHFVPFVLLLLFLVPFYAMSGAEKLAFMAAPQQNTMGRARYMVNHFKLVQGLAYVLAIILLIRRYGRRVAEVYSAHERINLKWLRHVIGGISTLMVVSIFLYVLEARDSSSVIGMNPSSSYDEYMLLAVTVFVYSIGYLGLRRSEALALPLTEPAGSAAASERPRYAKSGMDDEVATQYLQRLHELMAQHKPYRRGDLTLQDLAGLLSMSPHNLTEILNTRLDQNFYDFINGYRVREVQERLADPASSHLTLLAIGEEAGFNSKSSFNAAFKKHVNMTPSEYRNRSLSAA